MARKYRPANFDDLLGQDALVQTLTNAIKNNRLHHAYMLTGIRGVGKTTTARIIAKALNCIGMDGKGEATPHPCGVCENCLAIAADRHVDVLELDAASRTGVDDIREILDGVRYKPTNARYKIYIIDEVHMLSKNAFNALLKTLEEPPSHVKFIFATTEIRKVPVTVLSRCQRFDLQRLSIDNLLTLFNKIIAAERLKAEDEALHIIARAADGSARDGLSLLDQAISLGEGKVKAEIVKEMIGLADKNSTFDLFKRLVAGNVEKMLEKLQEMYKSGANPHVVLQDLVGITHLLAKVKLLPATLNDSSIGESEKTLCAELANEISIAVLSKIWQMLIKGLSEMQLAPSQIEALEMVLIRIAYSANMPTPYELLNDVKKNSSLDAPVVKSPAQPRLIETEAPVLTLEEFIRHLESVKKAMLVYNLKNDANVLEFKNGFMRLVLSERAPDNLVISLQKELLEKTGKKWEIDFSKGDVGQTIADKEKFIKEQERVSVSELPLVKAVLEEFKGAKIESVIRKTKEEEPDLFEEEGEL